MKRILTAIGGCLAIATAMMATAQPVAQVEVVLGGYRADSGIVVAKQAGGALQIAWPAGKNLQAEMLLDLHPDQPLIRSLSLKQGRKPAEVIATSLDPVATVIIGERDRKAFEEAFAAWFFSRPQRAAITADTPARPLAVKQRTVVAEGAKGSLAVFPAPHQSFLSARFCGQPGLHLVRQRLQQAVAGLRLWHSPAAGGRQTLGSVV